MVEAWTNLGSTGMGLILLSLRSKSFSQWLWGLKINWDESVPLIMLCSNAELQYLSQEHTLRYDLTKESHEVHVYVPVNNVYVWTDSTSPQLVGCNRAFQNLQCTLVIQCCISWNLFTPHTHIDGVTLTELKIVPTALLGVSFHPTCSLYILSVHWDSWQLDWQ